MKIYIQKLWTTKNTFFLALDLIHFFLVWSFHQAYKPNVQRSETLFQFRENYSKAKILCHVCNNVNIFQKLSRKIPWPCMCLHFIKYTKKLSFLNGTIRILIQVLFFSPKIVPFLFLHTLLELLVFELQCTKSQNNYVQCMNLLTELYCFLKGSTIAIGYRI